MIIQANNKPQDRGLLLVGIRPNFLVSKMSHTGKYHGNAMLIGGFDDFFITHRATGLDNALNASVGGVVDAVSKWEKGV